MGFLNPFCLKKVGKVGSVLPKNSTLWMLVEGIISRVDELTLSLPCLPLQGWSACELLHLVRTRLYWFQE